MIKADMLDAYNDEDVQQVRALCDKVLKSRDDDRKAKAMEQARATLAAAGLSLNDLAKARIKGARKAQYRGGVSYQHPTDKTLVWTAKGQKPKWLRELEASGRSAIELRAAAGVTAHAKKLE